MDEGQVLGLGTRTGDWPFTGDFLSFAIKMIVWPFTTAAQNSALWGFLLKHKPSERLQLYGQLLQRSRPLSNLIICS